MPCVSYLKFSTKARVRGVVDPWLLSSCRTRLLSACVLRGVHHQKSTRPHRSSSPTAYHTIFKLEHARFIFTAAARLQPTIRTARSSSRTPPSAAVQSVSRLESSRCQRRPNAHCSVRVAAAESQPAEKTHAFPALSHSATPPTPVTNTTAKPSRGRKPEQRSTAARALHPPSAPRHYSGSPSRLLLLPRQLMPPTTRSSPPET